MKKELMAVISAAAFALAAVSCRNNKDDGSSPYTQTSRPTSPAGTNSSEEYIPDEPETEPVTEHISPIETLTADCSTQIAAERIIGREEGSNTMKLSLADFISEGDVINSFTFVIYSADSADIGTFKGGCGISVSEDCPAGTDGWYQCPDFTAPTQGAYGEITWEVPGDIKNYISPEGEVLFGYWWGGCTSLRVAEVVCSYTRTRDIPVDETVSKDVGSSVAYSPEDNIIRVDTSDIIPEGGVPQAVTFNISSGGPLGKFTGAFGYSSSAGDHMSPDTAVFTDSSSLELTWFVPDQAKIYAAKDGEIMLGYWWSDQPEIKLDSVKVRYSYGGGGTVSVPDTAVDKTEEQQPESSAGFRSASEIVGSINVGWNLGNTLESYNYSDYSADAETAWGNPKTTPELINNVKNAGFNAIRIPVTWGEHMNGDTIDADWLARVKEVVDYAYNNDMIVILNMHHDDYTWFRPVAGEYAANSNKLCSIWKQIAECFADYGDNLLFEGMNEPRTVGSEKEWTGGTPEERAVVNKYAQDFINTVRSTGGKNAERTLIIPTYGASAETAALNDIVVPSDKNLVVAIHYYAPWKFSEGMETDFTEAGKSELKAKFAEIKQKFIDKGIPVIIDEFGCVNKAPAATRADYYSFYLTEAGNCGIPCFVWDNNKHSGESSFGLLDRISMNWNEDILNAIKQST